MGLGSILELCKEKYVIGAMFMFLRKKQINFTVTKVTVRLHFKGLSHGTLSPPQLEINVCPLTCLLVTV